MLVNWGFCVFVELGEFFNPGLTLDGGRYPNPR